MATSGPRLQLGAATVLFLAAASAAWPLPVPALQDSSARTESRDHVHLDVPLVKQPFMLCLAASLSMVLRYWGVEIAPGELADRVPVYKSGTTGRDYVELVEALGFRGFLVQPPFDDVLGHVAKGRPVIVSLPQRGSLRHAMVVVGFDRRTHEILVNDPASGQQKTKGLESFRQDWEKGGRWTLLVVPK